jgi:hypothetical protein
MKSNLRNLRNLRATLFGLAMLCTFFTYAQSDIRSKIDADRRYLSYEDEKTLEKSRGYIREDSTFYIGYMYSGGFKFTRANDKLGFEQCIVDLENAMRLIEKDYDKQLRTRTNDIFTYMRVSTYQNDYCDIAYWLEQSYQNIEQPQKAFETVERIHNRNLQMEQGIESFNTLAWIYHRNRMYTPAGGAKYKFLKNSVRENDSIANKYLDSALLKIRLDADVNLGLFDATYINRLYLYTYHYKAILMDYNLEIDSANFYYDELIRTGYYSSNNYAEFKMAMGEFPEADQYFHEAEQRDGSREKQTREYFYERGTLDTYRGHPEQADSLLKKLVEDQQGTPGYGWHSIALARAQHYEGLSAESQYRINKAAAFDELHIATTWGEEQYHLAIATLNYTNKLQFKQDFLFENDEWYFWLNPVNWYKYMVYSFQVNNEKLILAALVAEDPERKNVIYTLFSSENLVNFDEVWNMIDGFGNEYFIGVYKNLLEKDKRPKLKKYFRYFLGKLYLNEGNKSEATRYFESVLDDPEISDSYQQLLYARSCEGMALASSTERDKNYWTGKMYEAFPQLVPHSDLVMKFRLEGDVTGTGSHGMSKLAWFFGIFGVIGTFVLYQLQKAGRIKVRTAVVFAPLFGCSILCGILTWKAVSVGNDNPRQQIVEDLRNCNIEITTDRNAPVVEFESEENKDATVFDYTVRNPEDDKIITSGSLRVPKEETSDGGKLFAYRLFGIKKKTIGDEPDAVEIKKPVEKKK